MQSEGYIGVIQTKIKIANSFSIDKKIDLIKICSVVSQIKHATISLLNFHLMPQIILSCHWYKECIIPASGD